MAPVVVVGMMRSGTTLVQRLLAADPRLLLRLRLGGPAGRTAPRLGPDDGGPADRPGARPRGADQGARAGAVRDPPDVRAGGRGGDRLPRRRVPLARPGVGRRRRGVPAVARHRRLRAGLRPPAPDAPAAPVAEAAARGRRQGRRCAGCSRRRRTSATSTTCAGRSPTCTSCTCTATRSRRSRPGASLNSTLHAMHADTVDRERIGRAVAGPDGLDQRPGDGDPGPLGRRTRRSPTSSSRRRWRTRSARWAGCTTRAG